MNRNQKIEACVASYKVNKNLKLVGSELGIPWQTVYVYLKEAGVQITGDKKRYGSTSDKLAREYEDKFKQIVPQAIDNNQSQFQSTVDFFVGSISVDVKVSRLQNSGKTPKGKSFASRWAYCISKQKDIADVFVLFALDGNDDIKHIFAVPNDVAVNHSTISIPFSMRSKWAEFKIDQSEVREFLVELGKL
tara:strand:- start:27 stop:599 length:573 start_codon:yes stop_codon:yes gene_type:complete